MLALAVCLIVGGLGLWLIDIGAAAAVRKFVEETEREHRQNGDDQDAGG